MMTGLVVDVNLAHFIVEASDYDTEVYVKMQYLSHGYWKSKRKETDKPLTPHGRVVVLAAGRFSWIRFFPIVGS